MAHLVKKKRYLGCLWELETVTLPGRPRRRTSSTGALVSGCKNPPAQKQKYLRGITKEAIEADRSGGYLHKRLLQACALKTCMAKITIIYLGVPQCCRLFHAIDASSPRLFSTVRVEETGSGRPSVDQVSRAYDEFKTIPAKIQRRLMLKLIPLSPEPGGSDLRFKTGEDHKNQLKNRAAITRHLVDLYLDGKYKLS